MRQPGPWYSETRSGGGWFVKLGGDQHFLGKHPIGAASPEKKKDKWNPPSEVLEKFYQLMALRDTASKSDYAFETICALYVDELTEQDAILAKRYDQTRRPASTHSRWKRGIIRSSANRKVNQGS